MVCILIKHSTYPIKKQYEHKFENSSCLTYRRSSWSRIRRFICTRKRIGNPERLSNALNDLGDSIKDLADKGLEELDNTAEKMMKG